jgi:hypothetical protein
MDDLTSVEFELEGLVASVAGTIEEKTARLRVEGVFRRYSDVFSAYLGLAESPDTNIEALKRATFLAWYELNEPPFCSGVSDLPEDARSRVVALIEPRVAQLDSEFRWMLAYYFHLTDFAFPDLPAHPNLESLLRTESSEGWLSHRSSLDSMRHRGLMGEYWLSIFGSPAAQQADEPDVE